MAATAGRPMNETVPTAASRKRRIALPGGRFNKTSEVAAAAPEPAATAAPDSQAIKVRIALPGGRFNKTSEVAAPPEPAATAAPDSQTVKVRPQGADPHPLPVLEGRQVEIIRTRKLSPSSPLR